jgi:general secretion pathway protein G
MRTARIRVCGFTVIELLVVLAAIGLLLSVAAPRYVRHLDTARETALREDLHQLRDSIDKFYADQGRYPKSLAELVTKRYLRGIPEDPMTQRVDSWIAVAPKAPGATSGQGLPTEGVADVRSGAQGNSQDGSTYASW